MGCLETLTLLPLHRDGCAALKPLGCCRAQKLSWLFKGHLLEPPLWCQDKENSFFPHLKPTSVCFKRQNLGSETHVGEYVGVYEIGPVKLAALACDIRLALLLGGSVCQRVPYCWTWPVTCYSVPISVPAAYVCEGAQAGGI